MKQNKVTVSLNPATGNELGQVPQNEIADVITAVRRIREAQESWAALPFAQRGDHFRRIRRFLASEGEALAKIISSENGKTLADAYLTEVTPAIMACDYQIRHASRALKPRRYRGSHIFSLFTSHRVQRVPLGVVGIISPWNYPLGIPMHEILMALMAGNGVLYKAASETPLVGQAVQTIINAGDLPANLFVQVNLPGRLAGDAFLENGVDKLFFTGSVSVGKYLMEKAAKILTPISLELGGNDPMIICEDADLKRAVGGAVWAGFSNSGQSCGGVERIYVARKVYDSFLEKMNLRIRKLKAGNPERWVNQMGVMTTTSQVETIREHIREALEKGAVIASQSQVDQDLTQALPAVVLTNVNHDMLLMREESFGPILGVMPFDSVDEAIHLANDSDLGLTASVWSRNKRNAKRIASQLQAGVVTINDHLITHGMPNVPWGGFKQSGLGRTHGKEGLLEMTQPRLVAVTHLPRFLMVWWLPVPRWIYKRWVGLMQIIGGAWRQKLRGLVKLISGF